MFTLDLYFPDNFILKQEWKGKMCYIGSGFQSMLVSLLFICSKSKLFYFGYLRAKLKGIRSRGLPVP